MTVRQYLQTYNTLFTNPPEFLNVNYFNERLKSRFGFIKIRNDIPVDEIANIAQNVLDINAEFLSALFAFAPTPLKTWGETSKNDRTTTTNSETSGETKSTGHTDGQENVSAFNSTTSVPNTDNVSNSTQNTTANSTGKTDLVDNDLGERSGYNFRDYEYALNHFRSTYDIVINLVIVDILDLYVSPDEHDCKGGD